MMDRGEMRKGAQQWSGRSVVDDNDNDVDIANDAGGAAAHSTTHSERREEEMTMEILMYGKVSPSLTDRPRRCYDVLLGQLSCGHLYISTCYSLRARFNPE